MPSGPFHGSRDGAEAVQGCLYSDSSEAGRDEKVLKELANKVEEALDRVKSDDEESAHA